MDFIFVSLQRINTDRESTSTSIAKELAKTHRVLYVNPPIDRKAWLFSNNDPYVQEHIEHIRGKKATLSKDELSGNLWILSPKNIIESINWIPATRLFSVFNMLNNFTFSREINNAIKNLGFKDFTLIIDKDIFRSFYLKELLKPKHTIYLDRDYTLGFDYWKRHGVSLEPKLISKCDAVVCNSTDFKNKNYIYNRNSFYISNGANLELFNPNLRRDAPEELSALNRPLVGYVGALITSRLDLQLITEIARSLTRGTLVLVGAQDEQFRESELHEMENVVFIDQINTHDVPSYLSYFDACINPQLVNEITIGNFPLKIVEYLAMGKPVVATATNTMKEVFSDHTYLGQSSSEFVAKIQIALEEDDQIKRQERIEFVKNYSWERVSQKLMNVISILESK